MSLKGKIAVVTGASRGIGQGIALQLGAAGATVYVTGRKPDESSGTSMGLPSLDQTAQEVTERGGKGIACYVDHGDMEQVRLFFDRVQRETNGQLDILVNNAYGAVQSIFDAAKTKFYSYDPAFWDQVNNVGLRNNYFCAVYASRIMVENGKGLIINISSVGGLKYLFNVAYGVGKAAIDRMSADIAAELKDEGVTCISLWPGAVRTQLFEKQMKENEKLANSKLGHAVAEGETIEYAGKAVVALASDERVIEKTGRILTTADLGDEYGFLDIDGRHPPNMRSMPFVLNEMGWKKTAEYVPGWLKVPGWVMTAAVSKL